jgi:uncharacterized caspase-like protein
MQHGPTASSVGTALPRRVALVIGNRAYAPATPLLSPRADALTMASLLEEIGFKVQVGFDCSFTEFRQRLRDFADRIGDAEVALFFFSGHAVATAAASNHLLPVDADIHEPEDLGRVTMPLERVLDAMQRPGRVCLVFLDACHDDPFATKPMVPLMKGVLSSHAGLTSVSSANLPETLIGFAAEEGRTAIDGGDGLSPFTAALAAELARPGAEIRDVLRDVRLRVVNATEGRQQPWFKDKLTRPVVLVPPDDALTETAAKAAVTSPMVVSPSVPGPPSFRKGSAYYIRRRSILLFGTAGLVTGLTTAGAALLATAWRRSTTNRIALVVGTAEYQKLPKLSTPVNDARAISTALRERGFSVATLENPSRDALSSGIDRFKARLEPGGVGIFYHSGHAFVDNGRDYIVPADAGSVPSLDGLVASSIDISSVRGPIARFFAAVASPRTSIARIGGILLAPGDEDAAEPASAGPEGRAPPASPKRPVEIMSDNDLGVFTLYSTGAGRPALDGEGSHSPFAEAWLAALQRDDGNLQRLGQFVRADVEQRTNGFQSPVLEDATRPGAKFDFARPYRDPDGLLRIVILDSSRSGFR